MKEVIRYQNRKIYDPETSSYTNAQDIGKRMASGEKIKVVCKKTRADMTNLVLANYIASNFSRFATESLTNFIKENR